MHRLPLAAQITSRVALSFKHYRHRMRDKLLRYKHLLFVIAMLLFPTLSTLYGVTVQPLRVLFAPAPPLPGLLATLIVYLFLAMSWAHLQRDAILCESMAR